MSGTPCAIITGSSRGIGRGIAIETAKAGYDIVVNYAGNKEAALETQKLVEEQGTRAEIVQANVADENDRKKLVDETLTPFWPS